MTFDLVTGINRTSGDALRRAIDEFITDGTITIPQLAERLERLFGPVRAEMIAVTEVTRTFAEAEIISMRESGVVKKKRWNTANDELVCPICGPLHRQVADLDGTWAGLYDSPPAHPRCRCWVSAVIEVD